MNATTKLDIKPEVARSIEKLNGRPSESVRFSDLVRLKSGFDHVSQMPRDQVRDAISIIDRRDIEEAFPDESDRMACYRWIIRGLRLDLAIRRVKVSIEIAANAERSTKLTRPYHSPERIDWLVDSNRVSSSD